ncbi:MAG: galactokinase [Candidatus Glassbacteria bacterium]|nr:galactokinase [Candidatus Glassbacteria bacterium]
MVLHKKDVPEIKTFSKLFGRSAEAAVRSPARINIIGEHTDYNDGFVFPASINRSMRIAAAKRKDRTCRIHSLRYDTTVKIRLDELKKNRDWTDYISGTLKELLVRKLPVGGFDAVIGGDLPVASGLSSSAALELAVSGVCQALFDFEVEAWEDIKLARRAENHFVGVNCGIMDQFSIKMGRKGHGLFLDCRSLEYEAVPIPEDELVFVIADSRVERGLGNTEYHARQKQCERGSLFFRSINKSLKSLRDVSEDLLIVNREKLDPVVYRRCRHVITENRRVQKAVEALKQPDMKLFGEMMNISHESCKNDFEVSCQELDILVELARKVPGVLGARMTGAGFGGCTINLVSRNRVDEFQEKVGRLYQSSTGLEPGFIVTGAEDGVETRRF